MKIKHILLISLVTILLSTGCYSDDSNSKNSTVENNLFSQPKDNGDSTCGIRQTLISQKLLSANNNFYADILAMWKRIYSQTLKNYPEGMPKNNPDEELTEMFEKPLPDIYTETAVKNADGGPFTPPSSILSILKEDGYEMVKFYVDEDALYALFGADFVSDEISIFKTVFPESEQIDIEASTSTETLRETFNNLSSYYIVVVNDGMHWIGVTTTTVYDSLATSLVADTSNFGKLDGDQEGNNYNSFTGLVMEIQKK